MLTQHNLGKSQLSMVIRPCTIMQLFGLSNMLQLERGGWNSGFRGSTSTEGANKHRRSKLTLRTKQINRGSVPGQMNMESREDIFKTGRQSTCPGCWLRGSVGIYTHQPVSSRAAHGGGGGAWQGLGWNKGRDKRHASLTRAICRKQTGRIMLGRRSEPLRLLMH